MAEFESSAFLITGGASGLGEAVTRLIVANGGVLDLSAENGTRLIKSLSKEKMFFVCCNVCNEDEVQEALTNGLVYFNRRLSGVVNCAGIAGSRRVVSKSGTVHPLQAFHNIVNVNVVGTFNVLRLAAAIMIKQEPIRGERGVIINVASVAAFDGQIGQAAYSASKAAIVGMTLPLAREMAESGIRVLAIAPGLFNTPMIANDSNITVQSKLKLAKLSEQVPFPKRLGEPEEFASLVIHLMQNQYMNGEVVRLDGAIRMSAL